MLAYESVLTLILIGGVAGWVAGLLVEGYGFGVLGNILVGTLGAVIAGVLASVLNIHTNGTLGNLVAATIGALLLLGFIGLVRRL